MYRYSNGQISLSDFHQPMGMQLREDNRWVKKAQMIPWNKIEEKYADLFPSCTGNVAKPLQLALGACLIQGEYGFSDEEIVLQIQENPGIVKICGVEKSPKIEKAETFASVFRSEGRSPERRETDAARVAARRTQCVAGQAMVIMFAFAHSLYGTGGIPPGLNDVILILL